MFGRSHIQVPMTSDAIVLTPERPRPRKFVVKSIEVGACPADWNILMQPTEDWGAKIERRVTARLDSETVVSGLAPATYLVSLGAPDSTCYAESQTVEMTGATEFRDPVVFRAHPAISLHGHLASHNSRTEGISIVLLSPVSDALQVELADARGHFRFRHLRPGSYRILTHPSIYREQRIEIDQQTPATITLERPEHTPNPDF